VSGPADDVAAGSDVALAAATTAGSADLEALALEAPAQEMAALETATPATAASGTTAPQTAKVVPGGAYPAELNRRLCAAVSTDRRLARALVEGVLDEESRAIAVSPGTDLVTVARYALRAIRRRSVTDVVLLIILFLLALCNLINGGLGLAAAPRIAALTGRGLAWADIALLAVAWAAIFIERFARLYGRAARGLRPGVWKPSTAPRVGRWPGAAARLRRVAASQAANVTVSRGDLPFPGYGPAVRDWSLAIDVTRAASSLPPWPFTAGEVYEHVAAALEGMGLPGLRLSSQVFVTGAGSADGRLRCDPRDPGGLCADEGTVRQLIDFPDEDARPYLAATVIGWRGDLSVTTLVRFVRSPDQLFAETVRTALPPLGESAAALDGRGRWPGLAGLGALAGRSLVDLPWRLLASGPALAYRAVAPLRRARNRRRADRARDYAARLSIREAAAAPDREYFQDSDAQRYGLLIEQQLLRSLAGFLASRNVAAPDLDPPGGRIFRSWPGRPAQNGQPSPHGQVRR
jgi:hypothetical protein